MAKKAKNALITEDGQQMFFETDWFDLDAWVKYGHELGAFQRKIDKERGQIQKESSRKDRVWVDWRDKHFWEIGDWMLGGIAGGIKPKALKQHVRTVFGGNQSYGTVSNYMTVCKAIEPSRRRETLSFSMHLYAAKTRFTEKEQDALLDYAEAEMAATVGPKEKRTRKFSVKEFEAYIELKHPDPTPKKQKKVAAEGERTISITLKRRTCEELTKIAKIKKLGGPAGAMLWLAYEYIRLHKAELLEELRPLLEQQRAERIEGDKKFDYQFAASAAGQKAYADVYRETQDSKTANQAYEKAKSDFLATNTIENFAKTDWKGPEASRMTEFDEPSFEYLFALAAADSEALQALDAAEEAERQAYLEDERVRMVEVRAKQERERKERLTPEARAREEARDEAQEASRDAMAEGKTREEASEIAKQVYADSYSSWLEKFSAVSSVAIAER